LGTRIPLRAPSSLAMLLRHASIAALAIPCKPAEPGREWRSTAELIITTDPRLAASAG